MFSTTGLLTALWFLFAQRLCKCTGSPHPPASPDHTGGYAISGSNPGPSRCSSTDAYAIPLGHAGQWCKFRESEWRTTDSAPKEETTGMTDGPRFLGFFLY